MAFHTHPCPEGKPAPPISFSDAKRYVSENVAFVGAVMRWIAWAAGILVAIVVVVIAIVLLLPGERIARLAADGFKDATGRDLTFEGDVALSLSPLGVTTGPVQIANADWATEGPMVTAAGMDIGVNLISAIRGDIKIEVLEIDTPEIRLATNAEGVGNWEFEVAAPAATTPETSDDSAGDLPEISIDRAHIRNGRLIFADGQNGTATMLSGIDATLALPALAGTLTAEATAALNGTPLALSGRIEGVRAFLESGAVPVTAALRVDAAEIAMTGRAGLTPLAADLDVTADLGATDALAVALGQAAPGLPAGLGQTLALSGKVIFTENKLALRSADIALGAGNRVTGDADLDLSGAKPVLTADLSAGALDLTALSGGDAGDDAASGAAGWSTDPIDATALGLFDGTLALRAESLDTGTLKTGALRLVTEVKNARAVTEIHELGAYDGAVTGRVVVNARDGLSGRVNLQARGVGMQGLLSDLAGFDKLQTAADVDVKLLASGSSLAAMMSGLEGNGGFQFAKGALSGIDLAALLRGLDPDATAADARTIFDSIGATFAVEGGVLRNSDLAFEAELLRAEGAGEVDIGAQMLDYRIRPIVLPGEDGAGLSVPVLFTGSWADPRIRPDLEGLAEDRLREEADRLQERAEDRVREEVQDRLGVTLDEDATLEDAVRDAVGDRLGGAAEGEDGGLEDALQDRLREGLGGLLGNN